MSYDHKLDFFCDPDTRRWNLFDGMLVVIMFVEIVLTGLILFGYIQFTGGYFKTFVILRMLRLLRISRVFSKIPELTMMIKSM